MNPLLLLFLLALAAARSLAQEDPAHEALRQTRAEIIAAIESRDPDKIVALLHPDVIVTWQDGTVCHGVDELRAFYDRMGKDAFQGFKVPHEPDGLSILHGGDTATVAGRLVADYHLLGKAFEFESRWTATLVQRDGRWVVAAYHVSLNALDNPILGAAKSAAWIALAAGFLGGLVLAAVICRLRRKRTA